MRVAVDISLYPIDQPHIPPIDDFIARVNRHPSLIVETNRMSTQIRGEYAEVMQVLTDEVRGTFDALPKAVFAIKILNNPMED